MPGIDRVAAALAIGSGVTWLLFRFGSGLVAYLHTKRAMARLVDESVEEILGPGASRTVRVPEWKRARG